MQKYALISVYDKYDVLALARFLVSRKIKIISTGGTYRYLKENKVPVIEVCEITNFPEMLDGRVKTLHPKIHAGILAIRNNETHIKAINKYKIKLIDYVIVNLYPFLEKVTSDLSFDEKIEFIDIGGPTLLRAAAKNYRDVTVICKKEDYCELIRRIKKNNVTLEFRRNLAAEVFNLMSAYDGLVSRFMSKTEYSQFFTPSLTKVSNLRYGENPHQTACFYRSNLIKGAMGSVVVLNGKPLSYNNYKDVDVAWKAVNEFTEPACCAIKHNTPCGFALGRNIYDAYVKTYNVDSTSIFGGVISFNHKVDVKTAKKLVQIFLEVIAAPNYEVEALKILKTKKNLRVLKLKVKPQAKYSVVSIDGGVLIQTEDKLLYNKLEVVTKTKPTKAQMKDLIFAFKVVKYVRSNAIVVAKNGIALGIGGGQVNRIWPTQDALKRGKGATVLASDAFFPFSDVVATAAKAKIKAIIQPGGAIRDQESIAMADKYKIAMIFTGVRHFKH